MIPLKFTGSTIANRPMIPVLFEVPALNISEIIHFLVDSGAVFSALSEKQATLLKIDCALLPDSKGSAIGFGGTFKTKMINSPVRLTFSSGKDRHTVNYDSGFRITCIPPSTKAEDREKLLRFTPSVLGMDVLSKFDLHIDKKRVELTL